MNIGSIAKICHELNRNYCQAIGDNSQMTWPLAEEWQRESAIAGVLFCRSHPKAPDSAQHEAWAQEKLDAGWVYGEVKDADLKTHPCLVPFDKLPLEQQLKDTLFRQTALALLQLLQ